jgi:hypothetical protein
MDTITLLDQGEERKLKLFLALVETSFLFKIEFWSFSFHDK